MASSEPLAESPSDIEKGNYKNLPFAAEIRSIIWKYALDGAVARISLAESRGRDVHRVASPLAPLYVSKSTRADTIPLVLEHVEFNLCFTSAPLVQLQLGSTWPSLHHVKHIAIKSEQVAVYSSDPILFPHLETLTFCLAPESAGSLQPLASALGDASAEIRIYGIFALYRLAMRRHEKVRDSHTVSLRRSNKIRASKLLREPVELRIEVPLASDATLAVEGTYDPAERGWLRGPDGEETIMLPSMWTYLVWRMAVSDADLNAAILSTFKALRDADSSAHEAYHAQLDWLAQYLQNNAQDGSEQ